MTMHGLVGICGMGEPPESSEETNWLLYGAIGAGVPALAGVGYVVLKKKR